MKKHQTSENQGADQDQRDAPDIVATEGLMDKLLKVPKKELDKMLADEKNKPKPA